MKKIFLYFVLMFICYSGFSDPIAPLLDQRIRMINYKENIVVPVWGVNFVSTQIIFGNDEQVMNVQGGDADAWTVNVDKTFSNTLNIKPTLPGSNTNLSVITIDHAGGRRNYYFELHSVDRSDTTSQKTYAIIFKYPDQIRFDKKPSTTVLNPAQHHKNYYFHGDRTLMPKRIFDDGQFTYVDLQKNQAIPAIFAVLNARGDEAVVNFRRAGDRLIVLQTAPQFTLRSGSHVASIFNEDAIAHLRHGFRGFS